LTGAFVWATPCSLAAYVKQLAGKIEVLKRQLLATALTYRDKRLVFNELQFREKKDNLA
jgi:hypothetical protein